MIDVIEVFGFNFIVIDSANSDSDSKNSKNSKNSENSENSQNSVDFKKSEKFMTDLFQRIYIYDYVKIASQWALPVRKSPVPDRSSSEKSSEESAQLRSVENSQNY